MKRTVIVGFLFCCMVLTCLLCASSSKVVFTDACHCTGCHGVARWSAKTDPEMLPNPNDAQPQTAFPITPSQMFQWPVPTEKINESSQRIPDEEVWYVMSGEVVDVKVEQDGDIHVRLKDVNGDVNDGVVGVEVPVPGQPNEPEADDAWCEIRQEVFRWSGQTFPFHFESDKTIPLTAHPVVEVIGKAFFDIDHAPKNGTNVRAGTKNYSVWEIHPVMELRD